MSAMDTHTTRGKDLQVGTTIRISDNLAAKILNTSRIGDFRVLELADLHYPVIVGFDQIVETIPEQP